MENPAVPFLNQLDQFMNLPLPEDVYFLEYVWIDGTGQHTRSKRMEVNKEIDSPSQCSIWNYDGSSTGKWLFFLCLQTVHLDDYCFA